MTSVLGLILPLFSQEPSKGTKKVPLTAPTRSLSLCATTTRQFPAISPPYRGTKDEKPANSGSEEVTKRLADGEDGGKRATDGQRRSH